MDKPKFAPQFGIRVWQQFNYQTFHSSVCLEFNNDFFAAYLGPSYSLLGKNYITPDPVDFHRKNNMGINAGFRIGPPTKGKTFTPFFQINFNVVFSETSQQPFGTPYGKPIRSGVVENDVGIGVIFNLHEEIKFFAGGGFGSTDKFFLNFNSVIPHSFIGLSVYF